MSRDLADIRGRSYGARLELRVKGTVTPTNFNFVFHYRGGCSVNGVEG